MAVETISAVKSNCVVIGSAFIEEIGSNSPLFELSSLPLLFRELHDDCLKHIFSIVGTCVLACGHNGNGQLGLARFDGKRETPQVVASLSNLKITQLCCGWFHSLALLGISENGTVLSWGWNYRGQLGHGDNEGRNKPIEIASLKEKHVVEIGSGAFHNLALIDDGNVYSWGYNYEDQLGLGHYQDKNLPTQIPGFNGKKVSKIFCSHYQNLAIIDTKEIFAWGCNLYGQLGFGDKNNRNKPQQVLSLSGKEVISFVGGNSHSLLLTGNGEVMFAGDKLFGTAMIPNVQSTFEIIPEFSNKNIISIASGTLHYIALSNSGELYGWGSNLIGQLGVGDKNDRLKPEKIESLAGKHVTKIFCGTRYSFVILNAGEVFGFGCNRQGQLGIGATNPEILSPTPNITLSNKDIIAISCGDNFSLALLK